MLRISVLGLSSPPPIWTARSPRWDHHVEAFEGRDHPVDEGLHLAGVPHVHVDRIARPPRSAISRATISERYGRALRRDEESRRAPDLERALVIAAAPPFKRIVPSPSSLHDGPGPTAGRA